MNPYLELYQQQESGSMLMHGWPMSAGLNWLQCQLSDKLLQAWESIVILRTSQRQVEDLIAGLAAESSYAASFPLTCTNAHSQEKQTKVINEEQR